MSLTRYNSTLQDTAGLDYHETILGHLVLEQRLSFDDALYYLDSMARSEVKGWHSAKGNTQMGLWASVGAGGLAFVSAGFGPVGMVLGGTIAGIGCGFSWFIKDRAEHVIPFRECESNLITHHPWVRDEMKRLVDSGIPPSMVISRYDLMLKSFFAAGGVTSDPDQVIKLLQPIAPEQMPQVTQPANTPVSALVQKRLEREQRNILGTIPIDDSPIAVPEDISPLATIQGMGRRQDDAPAVAGTPQFVAEMSHAVRSSLIVGIPGSGKGLTTAVLIQEVRKRRPELRIFGIDPKNDSKETGYWQGYTAIDRFDAELLDGWEIQSRLDAMLNQFGAAGENALLVIDEFATVIGCCEKKWVESFNAKLQKIVQMGNSKNRFLWLISQSGNLGELKLQPSLRSSLELLAIVRPGSDAAIAGLIKTDLIADKDADRMKAMMQRSPVNRAFYYGKFAQWSPMPELPNLSGYDRDKRQWIDGATPPEPVSKATDFYVAAVDRAVGQVLPFVSKDVQPSAGTDDIKAELVRYLSGVSEPKKVSQIRTSIKPPHRGIASDELRLVLAELMAENQIQKVGSRFTANN
jgi:hypothetical protein